MTDLDPLAKPPKEDAELPAGAGREPRGKSASGMAGPSGHAPTTESTGDPDRHTVASGTEAGAGAGAIAGTAVAGPIGLAIGAAVGAAAGSAAEAADQDKATNEDQPMSEAGSAGTGPVDPNADFTRKERD